MTGGSVKLFTISGFEIRIHVSWLIVVFLIVWTLAQGFFPVRYPGLSSAQYWLMGIGSALGLFLSIILHELSHSLVARKRNLPMRGITLFIFGGIAEMEDEPPDARAEFQMAIAGPLTSIGLAFLFYVAYAVSAGLHIALAVTGALMYLAYINGVLAIFNLIPAFPLDGGRIFRSYLWYRRKSLRSATRTAARAGSMFGYALMALGFMNLLFGNAVGGLWWILIGMFLNSAASGAWRQVELRETLKGEPIRRFMRSDVVTAPPDISLRDFVNEFVYRYHFKMFPVVEDSHLVGCVSTKEIGRIPREDWARVKVEDIAVPCGQMNCVAPDTDAFDVLSLMNRTGNSRIVIRENSRLDGVVSLKDMLRYLSLKLELHDENSGGPNHSKAA
jgi:Zn-dependent protease/predicted transcriptional regulator